MARIPAAGDEIAAELAAGSRLDDRYEIVRPLGRGGMGVVYLARDHDRDGSLIALKLLPPELTADPHGLALLRQEASVAMRLSHPNIVRLHNLEGRTRKYVTMEYVDGGSLADLLVARVRGQLPRPPDWSGAGLSPAEVMPLLAGIAAGLDHAHSERVIHRDMKPANVLIKRRGDAVVPKVADFGIAREIREMVSRVTQNVVAGTPSYMSPEHYRGEKLDPRADVYSVAATVYTLLAARPPFSGGELSWQILNKDPDPIHGVAPAVMAAVKRGMCKDLRGRPESCGALALSFSRAVAASGQQEVDLETINPAGTTTPSPVTEDARTPIASQDTPTTRPAEVEEPTVKPPPPRRFGAAHALALAVALGCGTAVLWPLMRAARPPPPASPSRPAPADALAHRKAADAAIDVLINDTGQLEEAEARLNAVESLTDANVNSAMGLGAKLFRIGKPDLGEKVWDRTVSRRLDAVPLLQSTAEVMARRGDETGRKALDAAISVVGRHAPRSEWPRDVEDRRTGKPDASKVLEAAREAWSRGAHDSVIELVAPLDPHPATRPALAVLLCAALVEKKETGRASRLLDGLQAARLDSADTLRALFQAAEGLGRWPSAREAAERWVYVTKEQSADAYRACATAAEALGEKPRASGYLARAAALEGKPGAPVSSPSAAPR